MLTRGELTWGSGRAEAAATEVKGVLKLASFSWIDWRGPQQVLPTNQPGTAPEFIEWSVMPAPAGGP